MCWPGAERGCGKPEHLCHYNRAGMQAQRHHALAEVGREGVFFMAYIQQGTNAAGGIE
jgi:hypothetical protein